MKNKIVVFALAVTGLLSIPSGAEVDLLAVSKLSHKATVYMGDRLDNMRIYREGKYVRNGSFERRYGPSPSLLDPQFAFSQYDFDREEIPNLPLTESFSLIHEDSTEYVFVYLHGITDSAYQGKDLGRVLFNAGHNFISQVLPGHGADSGSINEVSLADWRLQVDLAVGRASRIGKHVVLIGLSTGGALAIDRAQRRPEGIAGIVPIAPAIGIGNKWVNFLEKVRLPGGMTAFELIARMKPFIGSQNTEQTEIRQIVKGAHSVHVLHQLGMAIQDWSANNVLQVPVLMISSKEDDTIAAEKVPEFMARVQRGFGRWLEIRSRPGRPTELVNLDSVRMEGVTSILYTHRAPDHSHMVYDPRYAVHQVRVEAERAEGKPQIIRPFVTLDETNPVFQEVGEFILTRYPKNCWCVIKGAG